MESCHIIQIPREAAGQLLVINVSFQCSSDGKYLKFH